MKRLTVSLARMPFHALTGDGLESLLHLQHAEEENRQAAEQFDGHHSPRHFAGFVAGGRQCRPGQRTRPYSENTTREGESSTRAEIQMRFQHGSLLRWLRAGEEYNKSLLHTLLWPAATVTRPSPRWSRVPDRFAVGIPADR
jgi:hypothetical protein